MSEALKQAVRDWWNTPMFSAGGDQWGVPNGVSPQLTSVTTLPYDRTVDGYSTGFYQDAFNAAQAELATKQAALEKAYTLQGKFWPSYQARNASELADYRARVAEQKRLLGEAKTRDAISAAEGAKRAAARDANAGYRVAGLDTRVNATDIPDSVAAGYYPSKSPVASTATTPPPPAPPTTATQSPTATTGSSPTAPAQSQPAGTAKTQATGGQPTAPQPATTATPGTTATSADTTAPAATYQPQTQQSLMAQSQTPAQSWGLADEIAQRQQGPDGLNRMQAAAMAKYLGQALQHHNNLMSTQRTNELMSAQNNPATYALAQKLASQNLPADQALHLAMTQTLANNGQYLGLGASLPYAQKAMDNLNNYEGELAVMFGVPWEAKSSGGAYNIGSHGLRGYQSHDDGTHSIRVNNRVYNGLNAPSAYVAGTTMRNSNANGALAAAANLAAGGVLANGGKSATPSQGGGTDKQQSDTATSAINAHDNEKKGAKKSNTSTTVYGQYGNN